MLYYESLSESEDNPLSPAMACSWTVPPSLDELEISIEIKLLPVNTGYGVSKNLQHKSSKCFFFYQSKYKNRILNHSHPSETADRLDVVTSGQPVSGIDSFLEAVTNTASRYIIKLITVFNDSLLMSTLKRCRKIPRLFAEGFFINNFSKSL
jgi:hypothetical protein